MRHVFVLSMKGLFFISRAGRYCLVVLKVELPNIAHKRKSQLKGGAVIIVTFSRFHELTNCLG